MTLQVDTAVRTLSRGAIAKDADPLVIDRLADVQKFLGHELSAVEDAIERLLVDGPEPAVAAAQHLVSRGGKRVRPIALILAARCFPGAAVDDKAMTEMAAVVELVHSATLLHDDVVDEGAERRGAITSRRVYGNGVSVLSGDLLLVNALERTRLVAPSLLPALIGTLRRLVDGEIIQLRGRTELDASEETYLRVLSDKTASLFSLATQAGARLAGANQQATDALGIFGEQLGVAFQLIDDVIDYTGEKTGKALFADLTEGKLTLPLVLAIERDPSLLELVKVIHSGDSRPIEEVSRRVIGSGSCDVVRQRAHQATRDAIAALGVLPASPAVRILELVAREMTQRVA